MNTIDLDAIINTVSPFANPTIHFTRKDIKSLMLVAIHQALVLASEEAKVKEVFEDSKRKTYDGLDSVHIHNPNGSDSDVSADKQSILDVEKLIK